MPYDGAMTVNIFVVCDLRHKTDMTLGYAYCIKEII